MKKTVIVAILGICLLAIPASATIWDGSGTYTLTTGETVGEGILKDTATLNMTGGTIITGLVCQGSSTFNMSGGTLGVTGGLNISESAIANITGGSILNITAGGTSAVNMTVSSYQITPSTFDGFLSGYWANGLDSFYIGLGPNTLSHINLIVVPEPISLLFVFTGTVCLLKRN